MPLTERPTEQYVKAVAAHYRTVWRKAQAEWIIDDSYYWRDFPLWEAGDNRPSFHPARPTALLDHATDTQLAYDPKVHREATGRGKANRKLADELEEALAAVLMKAALIETSLTWKTLGKHMLLYGYGNIDGPWWDTADKPPAPKRKTGETNEEFQEREQRYEIARIGWFPIRINALHPSRILADPSKKTPDRVIKESLMYVEDLAALTSRKQKTRTYAPNMWPMDDKDPMKMVKVLSFRSPYWHSFLAGDSELEMYVEKNPWGFVPFCHAFAGFGAELTNATLVTENATPSSVDTSRLAVGLLRPVRESLKVQAQSYSAKHNAVMETGFQQRGTNLDPAEAAEAEARGGWLPGKKDDYWWMEYPEIPRWMFSNDELVADDIEFGTYARSLAGRKEPGVHTVGQTAILSTAARRKFLAPARQMEHLASITASRVLMLIDRSGETLEFDGYKLGPKHIAGNYNCRVSFDVIDAVLQLQMREMGLQELAAGVKSTERYWEEDARLNNISQERREIIKDRVRALPAVAAAQEAAVMVGMGLEDAVEALEEQLTNGAAGANGLVGPDGRPISSNGNSPQPLSDDTPGQYRRGQNLA